MGDTEKTLYFWPMPRKRNLPRIERLEIIDAGAKGRAIGKAPDGRVVFVPFAAPGDVISAQVTKKRRAYYEARIEKVHSYSDLRSQPSCEHFGICGGCKWQHISYPHQLVLKQNTVVNNLKRIGHLDLPEVETILPAPESYHYRNKMEFSFSNQRWLTEEEIAEMGQDMDRRGLGLHIPGRWDRVLDLENCYLQAEPSNAIRLEVRRYARENGLSFFDPKEQSGFLRTLMIRNTNQGEVMVLIQFYEDQTTARLGLLTHLQEQFPEITSLQYVINSKANDTLYDQRVICFAGKDHIMEEMEGLQFKVTAKSFYQTNSAQALNLYRKVREYANLQGGESIYDLYTGTGTIALFLASKAKHVLGIESVPEAIEAAEENASRNGMGNTTFVSGDMKEILNEDLIQQYGIPDLVITDPPRDGMHPKVVQQLLKCGPARIIYVSCNSATQARDLALLDVSYSIEKVQPVDMFPQTHHVENIVLLKKRGPAA